jgi:hypothetical protein
MLPVSPGRPTSHAHGECSSTGSRKQGLWPWAVIVRQVRLRVHLPDLPPGPSHLFTRVEDSFPRSSPGRNALPACVAPNHGAVAQWD